MMNILSSAEDFLYPVSTTVFNWTMLIAVIIGLVILFGKKFGTVQLLYKVSQTTSVKLLYTLLFIILFGLLFMVLCLIPGIILGLTVYPEMMEVLSYLFKWIIIKPLILPFLFIIILYQFISDFLPKWFMKQSTKEQLLSLDYEPMGKLSKWSKATGRLNERIGLISRFYYKSKPKLDELLDGSKGRFVILSPSANKGIYEAELGQLIASSRKDKEILMIASDLSSVAGHTANHRIGNLEYKYYENVNAEDMKEKILHEEGISKVQAIWDLKGFLWYRSVRQQSIWQNLKKNRLTRLEEAFAIFHNILEPGGFLIVDACEIGGRNRFFRSFSTVLNLLLFNVFGFIYGYMEESTYYKMRKTFELSSYAAKYDVIPIIDGPASFVILRKITD